MSKSGPWIILYLVAAVWGGSFAAIKYVVELIGPYNFMIVRFVLLSAIAIPWIFISFRKQFSETLRQMWGMYIFLSVLWLFGYHLILYVGESVLPAAAAGLIVSTYPIWTILIASATGVERMTLGRGIGAIFGFSGTLYMTWFGAGHEAVELNIEGSEWIKYSLLTLISPIVAAVHTLIARRYLRGENRDKITVDPFVLNLGFMAPTGFFSLIFLSRSFGESIPVNSFSFWLAMFYLVVMCMIFTNIGWYWAIKWVDAGQAAITSYTIPLFGLVYSRLLLNEPIGVPTMIGASGIVAGVIIAGIEEWFSQNGKPTAFRIGSTTVQNNGIGENKKTGNKKLATRNS